MLISGSLTSSATAFIGPVTCGEVPGSRTSPAPPSEFDTPGLGRNIFKAKGSPETVKVSSELNLRLVSSTSFEPFLPCCCSSPAPELLCDAKMTCAKSSAELSAPSRLVGPAAICNTELTVVFTLFGSIFASVKDYRSNKLKIRLQPSCQIVYWARIFTALSHFGQAKRPDLYQISFPVQIQQIPWPSLQCVFCDN